MLCFYICSISRVGARLGFVSLSWFFVFKQKTAYEVRISDWSSDVCSSDLQGRARRGNRRLPHPVRMPLDLFWTEVGRGELSRTDCDEAPAGRCSADFPFGWLRR